MDPITLAALLGLGGKALDAGVGAWKAWLEAGRGGVRVAADGTQQVLHVNGARTQPWMTERRAGERPVPFEAVFVPADLWAQQYLSPDQPVLIVIEEQTQPVGADAVVAIGLLGDEFEGSLPPGRYLVGAFVFIDDDPDHWRDADGGGLIELSISSGQSPFRLEVPIEAIAGPADIFTSAETLLFESGYLHAGQHEQMTMVLEAGVTYVLSVCPEDPFTDLDLLIYDEHGNIVDRDQDATSEALCNVTPLWTGPFTIVVACQSGRSGYELLVQT
jgi:hypothetical protein